MEEKMISTNIDKLVPTIPKDLSRLNFVNNDANGTLKISSNNDSKVEQKNSVHTTSCIMNIDTIRKMLHQFLTLDRVNKDKMTKIEIKCSKYNKEELAQALNIAVKKLGKILFDEPSYMLIREINLPLIRLYCKTKFYSNGEW
jgi:hypothetical protein